MHTLAWLFELVARRFVLVLLALHAIVIVFLAASLPAGAWFVGDPGIKLIAARSAVAHPSRPLETELPPVTRDVVEQYRQPFFVPHDDHAHAFTSALFPLLTAPFLALFGLRGLYVLPAIGWLLIAPLTVALSRRLQTRASPTAVWIAMAAFSPFVFYGLEFWEHSLAVAALLGAACLALGGRLFAAGVVGGIAVLLRPECGWSLAAIALVVTRRQPRASSFGPLAGFVAGVALALAPQALYNLLHFSSLAPEHVSGNLAQLQRGWWEDRRDFASIWLGVHRAWTRVAFALVILGAVAGRLGARRRWTMAVAMIGVLGLALELGRGHELRENLWRACPLALLALLPPGRGTWPRRDLWLLILVPLAGGLLTAPNDGGGQWGPRYLLAIVPPLMLLVFDTTTTMASAVGRRAAWFFVAAVFVASAAVTHSGYLELSQAKSFYAAMADETAREARGRPVLTDVWWVPQVNAAVLDHGRVLWVDTPEKGARWLGTRPAPDVLLVLNPGGPAGSVPLDVWTRGTCYRPVSERRSEQELVYLTLSCR
jgi:hypothetical protein